jgi:hypothetical protein
MASAADGVVGIVPAASPLKVPTSQRRLGHTKLSGLIGERLAGSHAELVSGDDCGGGELANGDELAEVVVAVVVV